MMKFCLAALTIVLLAAAPLWATNYLDGTISSRASSGLVSTANITTAAAGCAQIQSYGIRS